MHDVTPSPQNRRRTDPVRVLRVAEQRLHGETLADDESEAASGVSSRGQDLAAVMALIPGVRVVMLSSSPAVQDVEHARGGLRALGPACEDAKGGTVAGDVPRRRSSTCLSPTRPWAA